MAEVTSHEQKKKARPRAGHPFFTPEERLAAWRNIRGMWKGRKPSPSKALKKLRAEWDRELPSLRS
ncbi:MAG: hypothetical protein AB7G75_06480 [Candidatus Binatia bacterium]